MAAGDTVVTVVVNPTAASVKTALDAAITATSVGARVTVCQLNVGQILITAIEV